MAFSDVIADAKGKGFTEPDPRDDLSGTDVARKVAMHHPLCARRAGAGDVSVWAEQVTILARQCGIDVELDTVPVESLVPASLQDWAPAEGEVLADAFVAQMKACVRMLVIMLLRWAWSMHMRAVSCCARC